jgi:hypothetical protein
LHGSGTEDAAAALCLSFSSAIDNSSSDDHHKVLITCSWLQNDYSAYVDDPDSTRTLPAGQQLRFLSSQPSSTRSSTTAAQQAHKQGRDTAAHLADVGAGTTGQLSSMSEDYGRATGMTEGGVRDVRLKGRLAAYPPTYPYYMSATAQARREVMHRCVQHKLAPTDMWEIWGAGRDVHTCCVKGMSTCIPVNMGAEDGM